ncbi:hypothetical protein DB29_03257 [Shouchella clausii]|nr:hypothetical protein DB29_03257 [Shouchella clausii]
MLKKKGESGIQPPIFQATDRKWTQNFFKTTFLTVVLTENHV